MAWWRTICVRLGAVLCVAGAACDGGGHGHGSFSTLPPITLAPAFGGASFSNPVKLVQHPADADRWYVVEQGGRVRTFLASNPSNITTAADVVTGGGVTLGNGEEQGLLGMAFDPSFAASHEIYLTYTDTGSGNSVLARWVSSNNGLTFAPDTAPVVLAISHSEFPNHNGGDIMFGRDGFLYYSMGDGGGADDPHDNGQKTTVLLGKILRIDVNAAPPSGKTYAIPSNNPFAGNPQCNAGPGTASCPEIWAYGLRNPWRMNFDPATGVLYAGDVGQNQREEIDVIVKGANYGWDCMEGDLTHPTNFTPCNFASFTPPEVVHGRSDARAITGGAVYRGSAVPGLVGFYVYGDFETGLFFAFDVTMSNAVVQRLALPTTNVSAFGQGRDGEIYVVGFGAPSIQRIVPSG